MLDVCMIKRENRFLLSLLFRKSVYHLLSAYDFDWNLHFLFSLAYNIEIYDRLVFILHRERPRNWHHGSVTTDVSVCYKERVWIILESWYVKKTQSFIDLLKYLLYFLIFRVCVFHYG